MISALEFIAIAAATLASEDLAAVASGFLVNEGRLGFGLALSACALGIWLGDLGLYFAGRAAGPALGRSRLGRRIHPDDFERAIARIRERAGPAVLATRFLPGTRLLVYTGAGAARVPVGTFAAWTAAAVLLWTPIVVGTVALFGDAAAAPLRKVFGAAWLVAPAALFLLWRARAWRERVPLAIARLRRWEFWPQWLFYAPVVPWVLWLVATRGARAVAAANPGFEDGGFVGESKAAILSKLPARWTLPYGLLAPGSIATRLDALDAAMARRGWMYPVVLKPDVGQRGVGVRVVGSRTEAAQYLERQPAHVIAQQHHPGPYEAGIFYYRMPGDAHGRILSVTDKHFPIAVGDGASTLRALIASHPRYRLQQRLFFERHAAELGRVPRAGELVRLGQIGNHAQGAIFLDGSSLITPALERRIDDIARQIDGFYIGRFDVRYRDPRALMAGEDLAIIELNGVTSEATHIYDPSASLIDAYRTLARQWRLVFTIGARNLDRGCRTSGFIRLLGLSLKYLRQRPAIV